MPLMKLVIDRMDTEQAMVDKTLKTACNSNSLESNLIRSYPFPFAVKLQPNTQISCIGREKNHGDTMTLCFSNEKKNEIGQEGDLLEAVMVHILWSILFALQHRGTDINIWVGLYKGAYIQKHYKKVSDWLSRREQIFPRRARVPPSPASSRFLLIRPTLQRRT